MKELTKLRLCAYDDEDKHIFTRFTTIQELAKEVKDFDKYYYRLDLFRWDRYQTPRQRQTINHFGVKVTSDREMRMTLQGLTEIVLNEYIQEYRAKNKRKRKPDPKNYLEEVLEWASVYTKIMNKINQSTHKDVERAIKEFKKVDDRVYKLKDLNDVKEVSGMYMLVLDAYNACYIGQSTDMKRRITAHWANKFGPKIDMFRPLDTTRIYVLPLEGDEYRATVDSIEYYLTKVISSFTLLNSMTGGKLNWQEATGLYE